MSTKKLSRGDFFASMNANEKTLRWWSCGFTIDGIKYKGSIKKLAASNSNSISTATIDDPTVTRNANNQEYILIELTNKIYYHHYTMHTNVSEIIEKIQELAPSLLTSNTNINDTDLIRHLPSLITLIHSQRHHNDQHNGIVLRYRLNKQEQIIENEAEAQWLKKHPFKRRMSLRATTSTAPPLTMETSIVSNKRKDINGGEEEQQESFDFHEDLEWDFVLHLMEEQMFDGGKRLNTSASIIGLHLKGKMLVFCC